MGRGLAGAFTSGESERHLLVTSWLWLFAAAVPAIIALAFWLDLESRNEPLFIALLLVAAGICAELLRRHLVSIREFSRVNQELMRSLADGEALMSVSAAVARENARLCHSAMDRAAEMEAVIDQMKDAVVVTDPRGHVVRRNKAAGRLLRGLTAGEELSESAKKGRFRLETPDGEPLLADSWPMNRAMRGERLEGLELVVRAEGEQPLQVSVDGCPVTTDNGEVILGVTVIRDVTADRETERLKDEFLSIAAHELKTPLTSLKGYAQILCSTDRPGLGDRERRALTAIASQVDRIDRMVQQFLLAAEVRSERLTLHREPLDLSSVVVKFCREFGRSAGRRLVLAAPPLAAEVLADPNSLELVLSNLVHNAVKHSPDGAEVQLGVGVVGTEAVVSVRDFGNGIPAERQAHLFERFYQIQPGTGGDNGIGLGLYLCRELIAGQGGRMWFDSEEGKGSTFSFALPLAQPSVGAGGSAAEAAPDCGSAVASDAVSGVGADGVSVAGVAQDRDAVPDQDDARPESAAENDAISSDRGRSLK